MKTDFDSSLSPSFEKNLSLITISFLVEEVSNCPLTQRSNQACAWELDFFQCGQSQVMAAEFNSPPAFFSFHWAAKWEGLSTEQEGRIWVALFCDKVVPLCAG